jgi:NAD(P)-dependent dehydrogenase (short-subunit alcohol dehydrogenase family)
MRLQDKMVLVTGGNRGIGLEVCRQLGMEGARILLGSRNIEKGNVAAANLSRDGVDVQVVQIDISNPNSIQAFLEKVPAPVDILVNNAAILDRGKSIVELPDQLFEHVLRTNLMGVVMLTRHLCRGMIERGWGRIVNVTSGMGSIGRGLGADSPAYRLSKLALDGFTVILAQTLQGTGILVNAVDPGWVRTQMGGPSAHKSPQEGARPVITAVLMPDDGPSGICWRDGRQVEW